MSTEAEWKTRRQKIKNMLLDGQVLYLKSLLTELQYISKRVLLGDINSVANTLKNDNIKIQVEPALCLACNFSFKKKDFEIKIPSKCPKCKKQRIEWPSIRIER
jgi:predicted Zn-ribbon and HTH transcriptional regulator